MAASESVIILNDGSSKSINMGNDGLMQNLNRLMTQLKSEFISETGVDYVAMKGSMEFGEYVQMAKLLSTLEVSKMAEITRKTFFINLYNCLTMHVLIEAGLPNKPLEAKGMWTNYVYRVEDFLLSLDDIEHGILRCNRIHPSSKKSAFEKPDDPRKILCLKNFDFRIHFALNCGAKSCPPIRIYSQEKLDKQLDTASKGFCSQEVKLEENIDCDNKQKKKVIKLSKLLMWYKDDFGDSDEMIRQNLSRFLKDDSDEKNALLDSSVKIEYSDYNWDTNNNT